MHDKIGLMSLNQLKKIIEAVSKEAARQERRKIIRELKGYKNEKI